MVLNVKEVYRVKSWEALLANVFICNFAEDGKFFFMCLFLIMIKDKGTAFHWNSVRPCDGAQTRGFKVCRDEVGGHTAVECYVPRSVGGSVSALPTATPPFRRLPCWRRQEVCVYSVLPLSVNGSWISPAPSTPVKTVFSSSFSCKRLSKQLFKIIESHAYLRQILKFGDPKPCKCSYRMHLLTPKCEQIYKTDVWANTCSSLSARAARLGDTFLDAVAQPSWLQET